MKILFVILVILSGCAQKGVERRNLDDFYMDTGVTRYFLPDLPYWLNKSESAACFRKESARFLNIAELRKSFSLSFEESIQFQIGFNREIYQAKQIAGVKYIPFNEEEKFFYKTSDKVQAKILAFKEPTYERVNLLWIDPLMQNEVKLKATLGGEYSNTGHPVVVSLCYTGSELEKIIKKLKLDVGSVKVIGFESLAAFNPSTNELTPFFKLYFSSLFTKGQKIYLYLPSTSVPKEFTGNQYKLIKL